MKNLLCGCILSQPAAVNTRCPEGWRLYLAKRSARSDLDRHHALVAIGWHHTTEGQYRALLALRRAA